MRLIHTSTLELELFEGYDIPRYAILSHTWGDEEVLFHDMKKPIQSNVKLKKGFKKIESACVLARKDNFTYIWVDTCCIEKNSSAELSEAINSMYTWYKNAGICYAYLSDVHQGINEQIHSQMKRSRWFTRGWTLQELIAPDHLIFYASDWTVIGLKQTLHDLVAEITGIEKEILLGTMAPNSVSVAKRMSWAAKRETKRVEDIAYCMLGIFGVNMPMLYGEGKRAFIRLQEEILKEINDESILAWGYDGSKSQDRSLVGILADSPAAFAGSSKIIPTTFWKSGNPPSMTSRGLRIETRLCPISNYVEGELSIAILQCSVEDDIHNILAIPVAGIFTSRHSTEDFSRIGKKGPYLLSQKHYRRANQKSVYFRKGESRLDEVNRNFGMSPKRVLFRTFSPDNIKLNLSAQGQGSWDAQKPISLDSENNAIIHVTSNDPQLEFEVKISSTFSLSGIIWVFFVVIGAFIIAAGRLWNSAPIENRQNLQVYIKTGVLAPRSTSEAPFLAMWDFFYTSSFSLFHPVSGYLEPYRYWCSVVPQSWEKERSRHIWWWPKSHISLKNHCVLVHMSQLNIRDERFVVANVHVFPKRSCWREGNGAMLAFAILILSLGTERFVASRGIVSLALLPVAAAAVWKLSIQNNDGRTLYSSRALIWGFYIVSLVLWDLRYVYHGLTSLSFLKLLSQPLVYWALVFGGYFKLFL